MVGVSCPSKVFLVSDPLVEPVDLYGVFNDAKRSVMVARCASSSGVLGVEIVVAAGDTTEEAWAGAGGFVVNIVDSGGHGKRLRRPQVSCSCFRARCALGLI